MHFTSKATSWTRFSVGSEFVGQGRRCHTAPGPAGVAAPVAS
jgi:hypothetical protein